MNIENWRCEDSEMINFIIPVPGSSYGNIIKGIVDPIRKFLPDSMVHNKFQPGHVNVHFFVETGYLNMVNYEPGKGVNIFMDHGMSDKCYRDAYKIKHFDYVCVPGPLWKEKMMLQGLPEEKILITGFSKLDPLFAMEKNEKKSNRPRVLWAPTHSNSVSSYPTFMSYLDFIPTDYEVIFSIHPFHKDNLTPTFLEVRDADLVISDASSLIYEAWALGKPVVFPDWLVKDDIAKYYPGSLEDLIYKEKIGYHADHFEELVYQMQIAWQLGLDEKTKAFMEDIFPSKYRGQSGKMTAKIFEELGRL